MRKVYDRRKRETGFTALGKKRGKYIASTGGYERKLWMTPISFYMHNGRRVWG